MPPAPFPGGIQRKANKLQAAANKATTFEAVAREIHGTKASVWSENHAAQRLRACEKDVFPWSGAVDDTRGTPAPAA